MNAINTISLTIISVSDSVTKRFPSHSLWVGGGGGGGGGRRELLSCPYPLKVQACPPRDQRPALRSRVSGQREEDEWGNLKF